MSGKVSSPSGSGVVVLGLTGLGKTFLLVAALSTIPQTIERTGIPGMSSVIQITWIRIDMSSIASIEALAEQIIRAVDDALDAGGKVYRAFLFHRPSLFRDFHQPLTGYTAIVFMRASCAAGPVQTSE